MPWDDRAFVFTNSVGAPLDGHYVSARWFPALLTKAGLPRVRFHDLRHSYASIALAAGVHARVVQETLGHSTIAVTLELYSHIAPTMQRDAARTVAEALFA
jgi:integrase